MDLFTITIAVVSGAAVGAGVAWAICRSRVTEIAMTLDAFMKENRAFRRTLCALRRNAFITNSKGHRVRYRDASPERQALAEK